MKRLAVLLALLVAVPVFAQDRLEKPVSQTSTAAVVNVTFTLGAVGFLQDVLLYSQVTGIQTGTLYVINSTMGHTNYVAAWVFTNNSQSRLSSAWPVQFGDVIRTEFTASSLVSNNISSCWFKNVVK